MTDTLASMTSSYSPVGSAGCNHSRSTRTRRQRRSLRKVAAFLFAGYPTDHSAAAAGATCSPSFRSLSQFCKQGITIAKLCFSSHLQKEDIVLLGWLFATSPLYRSGKRRRRFRFAVFWVHSYRGVVLSRADSLRKKISPAMRFFSYFESRISRWSVL